MICSCCGYEIADQRHPIEKGKKFVCDKCWNNPDLFFAERLEKDARFNLLSELASRNRNQPESILVNVMKLRQKDIELYVGKMKSRDILQLYEIDKFKDEELEGYQREQYEDRTSELIEYLAKCPIAVMPSIFVSLRNAKYLSEKGDFGKLEIPRRKGSIWIIDGQHRIGGFEKAYLRFTFAKNPTDGDPELFSTLLDYELPIVFIDTHKAAMTVNRSSNKQNQEVTPEDLERAIFFIVNKTQKGIHPSLKDALLYRINVGGIEGIPSIRKEKWRIRAAHVGISLNREIDSPLVGMINIGGKPAAGRPIQLNSFVSSLESLFKCEDFTKLSDQERLKFVKTYWSMIKNMFPEAFDPGAWKNYMLLKAIGVYCLNGLALDIYKILAHTGHRLDDEEVLKKIVSSMATFDWSTDKSPLSALGGMKGARSGYEKLKECLSDTTKDMSQEPNAR
jgi:DGQHR domain-containing protein